MNAATGFEFLRPMWLLALFALPVLAWLARRGPQAAQAWRQAVDPHLLPHLIERSASPRRRLGAWTGVLAYTVAVAVVALAGPSWREVEQPLWQSRIPAVIALDLSSASLATDLPPSRLAQMRARVAARLEAHPGGPLGFVAYAGDAFTVTPLTEDVANIALFLEALEPDVMPVDGQATGRAIAWSRELMQRGGFARGHIVVLTDRADATAERAAADARAAGFTVGVVGVGTARGAEVRTRTGSTVRVALDEDSLRGLARAGGGRYAPLGAGDERAFAPTAGEDVASGRGRVQVRQDGGYWLLPAVLLFALLAWLRPARALLGVALVACLVQPFPADAANPWRRTDQQAHAKVLRGVEAYRRRDYDRAAQLFARADDAVAHYNRGNALAKGGDLEEAVAAYDEALRRAPGMDDARANRAAVMAALHRQGSGRSDQGNDRQGGASDRGDSRSRRNPRGEGEGASRGGQGRQQQAPPDPAAQAKADAAQRQRMQSELQKSRAQPSKPARGAQQDAQRRQTPQQRERQLSNDAALRRIPDEPGSLLREKFRLEYERRQRGGGRE